MNKKIVCKCGASYAADELEAYMHNYMSYSSWSTHNMLNGTFNKVSVSTLVNHKLYCNKCHKLHEFEDLALENKQRICTCGEKYSFDDLKVIAGNSFTNYTSGNVYFDGPKVTISFLEYYSDVNANGQYYWQSGGQRLTMNLETGMSYMTNAGERYREFNKIYKRDYNSNAPKMFNCTYTSCANTLELTITAMIHCLIAKHADKPNLVRLIASKGNRKIYNILFKKTFKQIDDYMTNYYNNKYSYRIKSLDEMSEGNFKSYDSWMFPLRNRFINLNVQEIERARDIIQNIKQLENKRNYKRLSRETNNIGYEYACTTTKLSKKLRKEIYAEIQNTYRMQSYIEEFIAFTRFFKNKENVNKIYNLFKSTKANFYYSYRMNDDTMKLWMTYRNEQYLSNLNKNELTEKLNYMYDSMNMIKKIRKVYGSDWDINSVRFHNEKQFHDDLMAITRTDAFREMQDAKRKAELSVPFEMEEEVFKLENKDITIALNEYELTVIGNQMHICVGGYGFDVKHRNCRIAYIKDGDEYKACLELRVIKKDSKVKYELHQAKLKYNEYVSTNEKYFKIVSDWCKDNKIKIVTGDMNRKEVF